MTDYLPDAYTSFRTRNPSVATALDALASTVDGAGPLDDRSRRLVKLGIAIGSESDGAVRSNVRKALALGLTEEELRHAALLAITTCGLPTATAATTWIDEVLSAG